MDFLLPNESEMEKLAEEYAKIKVLHPRADTPVVETFCSDTQPSTAVVERSNAQPTNNLLAVAVLVMCCLASSREQNYADADSSHTAATDGKTLPKPLFPGCLHGQISQKPSPTPVLRTPFSFDKQR